jgi:hypothetical protein
VAIITDFCFSEMLPSTRRLAFRQYTSKSSNFQFRNKNLLNNGKLYAQLKPEEEEFAYRLAPDRVPLTESDMEKVASLYSSLFSDDKKELDKTYIPQYLLERTVLNYHKWHVPVVEAQRKYMAYNSDTFTIYPCYSSKEIFQRSPFAESKISGWFTSNKDKVTAMKNTILHRVCESQSISHPNGKKFGFLLNPSEPLTGSPIISSQNFVVAQSLIVVKSLITLLEAFIKKEIDTITVEYLQKVIKDVTNGKYYLVTIKSGNDTQASLLIFGKYGEKKRLAVYAGIDLAFAAAEEFEKKNEANTPNVGVIDAGPLLELVQSENYFGSPGSAGPLDGITFITDYRDGNEVDFTAITISDIPEFAKILSSGLKK